jgi:EpsI family protein
MNKNNVIVLILLVLTIAICFGLPKPKYTSPNILPSLKIPTEFAGWKSKDISQELNRRETYSFISNVFARVYSNSKGQELLLLILDAGNFHNPKVCYGATGYISNDMPDTAFNIPTKQLTANTVSLTKDKINLVIIYWLCVNQKLVSWTEQKVLELFYSLINKQKTGLMVRIDISISKAEDKIQAIKLAQGFINDLSKHLSPQDLDYIFGK